MYPCCLYAVNKSNSKLDIFDSSLTKNNYCVSVTGAVNLIDKKDYENDSATLYVGEKYKTENVGESHTQKLIINKDKYIHVIEHENGLMVYGMSEYLENQLNTPLD